MNSLQSPALISRPAEPVAPGLAVDVSGLAVLMVAIGVAGLAGALVLPAADWPASQGRFSALAGFLIVVGLGLGLRMNWARCAAAGMFAYAIYAQLSERWLQSEVLQLFVDSLRGVHDAGAGALASGAADLPPASASAAGLGLALCFAFGWFMVRLISAPVCAEFQRGAQRASGESRPRKA